MSDFKSVSREQLQKAFAIAHRGASNGQVNALGRRHLRVVARLIWDACGDDGPYRKRLDGDVEHILTLIAQEEMKEVS